MRFPHYSLFLKEPPAINTVENWDAVRINADEPDYYIPDNLNDYKALDSVLRTCELGSWIANNVEKAGCNQLFSIGCGVAYVEYNIKVQSKLEVAVSDFVPSVNRLQHLNVFDRVLRLDINNEMPEVNNKTVVYLGRIDTELSDEQLVSLFKRLRALDVKYICMVPAQLLTIRVVLTECYIWLKSFLKNKRRTYCGESRSLGLFKRLAHPYYELEYFKVGASSVFWFSSIA